MSSRQQRRSLTILPCSQYLPAFACISQYLRFASTAHALIWYNWTVRHSVVTVLLAVALLFGSALAAPVTPVKSVSTDGEATVYLSEDFSGSFDLLYDVTYQPERRNHGWTVVSLLLLGSKQPSASIAVGLTRRPHSKLAGFTTQSRPNERFVYKQYDIHCQLTCLVQLRGDARNLYASIDGLTVATWPRSRFVMDRPYIQINAEVHDIGDSLHATLAPRRTALKAQMLASPTCAFTTQGIMIAGLSAGTLQFFGSRTPTAPVTYVSLLTGNTGRSCSEL
jgi:hypothetical protein